MISRSLTFARHLLVAIILTSAFSSVSFAEQEEISDPFEPFNRHVFWMNDKVDRYLLEPIAEGYDAVAPEFVQTGVGNFFENLRYPSYLLSDLIQFKFGQALDHTGRFLLNSTVGLGGLIDVAKEVGLEKHEEDFGTALAHHGVPSGPYLMLPLLGPSNVRDGIGRVVDSFLDPIGWVAYETADDNDAFWITTSSTALRVVHTRAELLEAVEAAREASVDYYLFVQSAYYQNRDAVINDKRTSEEEDPFAEDEAFDEEFEAAEAHGRAQFAFGAPAGEGKVGLDWYLSGTH